MQDLVRNVKAIGTLFTAFGLGGDEKRIAIYAEALRDIPTELLEVTCRKIMLESAQMPKIAEIVTAARNLVGETDGTREKEWHEAWAEIVQQMHDAFVYKPPVFSTPEIAAAARAFGWSALCGTLSDDLTTARAQMRRFYEDACRRSKDKSVNEYLNQLLDHGSSSIYLTRNQKEQVLQASYPTEKENAPKSVKTILAKTKLGGCKNDKGDL